MGEPTLRDRIELYYASVPLGFADAEEFGPLRLFVRKGEGAPYYGGPNHAYPVPAGPAPVAPASAGPVSVDPVTAGFASSGPVGTGITAADIARVRARQRELGVAESFEWLAEVTPSLRALVEAAGLPVAERPLMVLDPHHPLPPQPLPEGVTIRVLDADDPGLPAVLALPRLAFADVGTAVGPAGRAELAAVAEKLVADGTVETIRPTLLTGHKVLAAAFAPDGTPLAAGHYHPARGITEIGGIGTLPTARRQGLGAAVMAALATHAREHGVHTVFLAYAEAAIARIYARLGFRPAGTTLLIADQPARGQ
ncbi:MULTISPECIES: GNAT family N-acetyltransferase [unclassified Streptomyces]|uniref:GNAT family N-acetyltransferase n=1 Tax=unclassified Streptomyces TaxID=2593676 RepID=UPI0004BDFAC9|nr:MULTISPECIES: GNAT family N-acetyltransferase [unclassified Streptomyces]